MLAADMGANPAFDVNGDESVTIGDAWCIVNTLSAQAAGIGPSAEVALDIDPDVNGDGSVTLEDLRLVVNHLAALLQGNADLAEGEGTLQAHDDSYSVVHDIPHAESTSVLDNDEYDLDPMLGYTIGVVSDVGHGVLALWSDGTFDYDPEDGFTGTDTFVYQLSQDGQTSQATVTLNVYNTPPVGSNKQYQIDWMTGQLDVDSATGLLSDAYDDDAIVDTVSAVIAAEPDHGSLTAFDGSDGSFSYVPGPSYSGGDTFTFRVFDGIDYSDLYVVQIDGGDPDPPEVSVTAPFGALYEGAQVIFTVTLDQEPAVGQDVSIDFTVDGAGANPMIINDYNVVNEFTTLVFKNNEPLEQTIVINTTADPDPEPDEGIGVQLSNPVNATIDVGQASKTVWNNDVKFWAVNSEEGDDKGWIRTYYYADGEDNIHNLVAKVSGSTKDGTALANVHYTPAQTNTLIATSSEEAPKELMWIPISDVPSDKHFWFEYEIHPDTTAQVTLVDN